ncbi:MAG: phosphoribosylaminoimidazolecarboxamide formyltransferase / IMP cyclohydrolase [Erysipelotrichaceae bacterium]|nr:MAG: phosphoribosylaminoimidazolecarboxamide formyltransferase / IMP [Erysipelotrichaceae bacterium]TXT16366.1 MAG: phosphoribosylaminoimidazolecarboxamide formyltransferase / IMP cyclohydrolase [Erysipelotrichaceae bacterium]
MKKRALLSVSDKTGLVELAQVLIDHDIELISTGGTKKTLQDAGLTVLGIEEVTGFPEMLDGRVKTLHPLVHGGLLFKRQDPSHLQQIQSAHIQPIDYVIVNLYPFQKAIEKADCTVEEAIENIDIGGPSMLRSAAKNHQDVTVICDPLDYPSLISQLNEKGKTDFAFRQAMAAKVYRTTAAYDALIAQYMNTLVNIEFPERITETYVLKQTLRYGENPHQKAAFYATPFEERDSLSAATQLHGKELSYNNIQDGAAALQLLSEFDQPAVIALKHTNPCGVGISSDIYQSWRKAYDTDKVSIFGGVVAFNREVDDQIAKELSEIFLEIVLAPSFSSAALDILTQKKNIRLMKTSDKSSRPYIKTSVRVAGGLLTQDTDKHSSALSQIKIVTLKQPTSLELNDALFGEKVVKHVKSNAIVIVKDGQTLGIGAGQMNRVGAAEIALKQAGEKAKGATLASDAFFPMNDTVALAAQYGITCIIQPGGSIKDQDSITACDEAQLAMIFTGERHFKH